MSGRLGLTTPRDRKVPEITAGFWLAKLLVTALGEAISDYSVSRYDPVLAVLGGFVVFCVLVALQLSRPRYWAWTYWLAAASVAVFGTMVADVLHRRFGVPYAGTTALFAVALAAVFMTWYLTERSLSIHRVDTLRRELYYWLTVVVTFALGTALGDLVATPLHLGYGGAALLFAGLLACVAVAWRAGLQSVAAFWTAYVLTRPLGASISDWLGKPRAASGLGNGDGPVAAGFAFGSLCVVALLAARDRRARREAAEGGLAGAATPER